MIAKVSITLLNQARIPESEFRISNDNYGGTICISHFALSQISRYILYAQQSKAAVVIQKNYRGYVARKQFEKMKGHGYYEDYMNLISDKYFVILNASRSGPNDDPSQNELDFMNLLNDEETFRVCNEYLRLLAIEERKWVSKQVNRHTLLPGLDKKQNTLLLYNEFSGKVLRWIGKVLNIRFKPNQDFLTVMRSGDILCRLATILYKNIDCSLIDKPLQYGLHKTIFFLELCKSLRIKRSLLFKISDLFVWPENDLHKKSALIVLRSIVALEKHARNSGWEGPRIEFDRNSNDMGVNNVETLRRPKKLATPPPPVILSPHPDEEYQQSQNVYSNQVEKDSYSKSNQSENEDPLKNNQDECSHHSNKNQMENEYHSNSNQVHNGYHSKTANDIDYFNIPDIDYKKVLGHTDQSRSSYRLSVPLGFDFAESITAVTPPITPALEYEDIRYDPQHAESSVNNGDQAEDPFDELYEYMAEGASENSLYEDEVDDLNFLNRLTNNQSNETLHESKSHPNTIRKERNNVIKNMIQDEVIP